MSKTCTGGMASTVIYLVLVCLKLYWRSGKYCSLSSFSMSKTCTGGVANTVIYLVLVCLKTVLEE